MVKKLLKAFIAGLLAVALIGLTACDLFGGSSNNPEVTLVLNGGSLSQNLTEYKEGTETVLPVPTKENYDFAGWYAAVDFSGEASAKISADETGDKIYYAKWTPKTFSVTLNLDGGSVAQNVTQYTYGVGATLPDNPTKTHYTFDGWYDSQNGGCKVTEISATGSGNKTFWARWNPVNHKLTLETNGGALDKDLTTYQEGVETLLPVPTKDYYDFEGWHQKSDLSDAKTDKITADKVGELTYYAKWTGKKYTVTLEANGGSGADLTEYTYGIGATLPTNVKKTSYDLVGWFEESDFSGEEVTEISATDNGNKTYYAKWISNTAINITAFGGYDEGAYLEFGKLSGDVTYKVSYKLAGGATAYTQIDSALVREISANKMRADAVGLKAGDYTLKIEAGGRTVTKDVTVTAYDRSGYAHFDSSASGKVYSAGVGGYKNDGTPKDGAQIIYVSDATKNTVKATIKGKSYTGLVAILTALPKSENPVIIRILDTVKAATWNEITYNQKPLPAQDVIDNTPSTKGNELSKQKYTMQQLIDLGFNTLNTTTASKLDGLYDLGYMNYDSSKDEFDSCWNNCGIGTGSDAGSYANNVTIEGIGTDAGLFQWGITWKYAKSVEVRNLTFDDYGEDACSFEGNTNSNTVDGFDSSRIWLHHCTFEEGKNYWDVCKEQDKGDGDGSTDFKKCAYITIAYNHYIETHKTGLIGGGSDHKTANVTFHHNYYQKCKSRLPLARQANMHMYNNYYENTTDTCLSIRSNGYAFIEYCYFKNAKNPIVTDVNPAYVKVYNCKFDGQSLKTSDYIKKDDTDREATFENTNVYNKSFDTEVFDISTEYFYYDAVNKRSNVTNLITDLDTIPTEIVKLAGVHKN